MVSGFDEGLRFSLALRARRSRHRIEHVGALGEGSKGSGEGWGWGTSQRECRGTSLPPEKSSSAASIGAGSARWNSKSRSEVSAIRSISESGTASKLKEIRGRFSAEEIAGDGDGGGIPAILGALGMEKEMGVRLVLY